MNSTRDVSSVINARSRQTKFSPGVSVSFANVGDRADIVAAVKKSLSDCSGGMKSPGEGGHKADEQTPGWEY